MGGKTSNKAGYFDKLKGLLEEYKSAFIVEIDRIVHLLDGNGLGPSAPGSRR